MDSTTAPIFPSVKPMFPELGPIGLVRSPAPPEPKPGGHLEGDSRSRDVFRAALETVGYSVRYNVRACAVEFASTAQPWRSLTDRDEADIRQAIRERCTVTVRSGRAEERKRFDIGRDRFTDMVNSIVRDADPFLEWLLYELPEWDCKPRLNTWIASCFTVDDDTPKGLLQWAGRSILLAAVKRALEPASSTMKRSYWSARSRPPRARRSGRCSRRSIKALGSVTSWY